MPVDEHVRTILVKKTCLPQAPPSADSSSGKPQSYTCSHCPKLFSSPSHLARHTLIHTGEKPCLCSECGQQFSQISSLERHQRTKHAPNKSAHPPSNHAYQCTLCHEYFSLKHNLKMHERKLHQIPTNFFCSLCSAYFTCKSSLQKHRNFRHRSLAKHSPANACEPPSITHASQPSDNWMLLPNDQFHSSAVLLSCPPVDDLSPNARTKSIPLNSSTDCSYEQQHVHYQILACNEVN